MEKFQMTQKYSTVAIALHWLIALAILFNLITGFTMGGYAPDWRRFTLGLHISMGVTIFLLSLLRFAWRLWRKPPPFDPSLAVWERRLAKTVHGLLYALMLTMPLVGWAIISSSAISLKRGVKIFNLVEFPPIGRIAHIVPPEQLVVHDQFVTFHLIGGCILAALLVGHIAGALKHQFIDRQPELQRMGIGWLDRSGR